MGDPPLRRDHARSPALDPVNVLVLLGIAGALVPATDGISLGVGVVALGIAWCLRPPEDARASARSRALARARVAKRRPVDDAVEAGLLGAAALTRCVVTLLFCAGSTIFLQRVAWITVRTGRLPHVLIGLLWIALALLMGLALRVALRDFLAPPRSARRRRPGSEPIGLALVLAVIGGVLLGLVFGLPPLVL